MAKQRRAGRRAGETAGGGRTVVGLLLAAGIAAGGFLLYRHTAPYEGSGGMTTKGAGRIAGPGQRAAPAVAPAMDGSRSAGESAPTGGNGARTGSPATVSAERPVPQAPFGESEEVFETGAKVYVAHCASCHGRPGHAAQAAAVQLWDAHAGPVQRMTAQPPGVLYEQIAVGVAAANGMPAMAGYRHVLSETEIWDLALLLRNARQELPDPVLHLLRGPRL